MVWWMSGEVDVCMVDVVQTCIFLMLLPGSQKHSCWGSTIHSAFKIANEPF